MPKHMTIDVELVTPENAKFFDGADGAPREEEPCPTPHPVRR